jgi:AAA+ superfamily predicted ATPase
VGGVVSARSLAERRRAEPRVDFEAATEPSWLTEVRLRAARHVRWLRHLWAGHGYENEHLLAISHSEVDRVLAPPRELARFELEFYTADAPASALSARLTELADGPADSGLEHLVRTLGLSSAERALLTLTLAGAADPSLARVFGYLSDGTGPADPTPLLARRLFQLADERPPGDGSPLLGWRLAEPVGEASPSALSTGWRADPALVRSLLGPPRAAEPLAWVGPGVADWSEGTTGRLVTPPAPVLHPSALEEIVGFLEGIERRGADGLAVEVELLGPPGSGRATLAAQAADRLGRRLVVVDAAELAGRADASAAAAREARRARLDGCLIAWEAADAMGAELWRGLPAAAVTFLLAEAPLETPGGGQRLRRSLRCGPISRRQRLDLWSRWSPSPAPTAVAEWALRPGEVRQAALAAPAGDQAVREVCRRLLLAGTPDLLTPLPLPYDWDDLVLSTTTAEHLQELASQARDRGQVLDDWGLSRLLSMGRGTTALFAGPSGTGKTMAAQVLARSLGLDLYRVDFAGVVSKYIGETEKHLKSLFEACERAPVLLLFDEADALFGKRTQVSDAHDRYANIEIDYLLQRMEQFDGLAILATNRKGDLDSAFVRRLRFIIDFAPPGAAERERLWRLALDGARDQDGRPLVDKLDWAGLARDLDLTGAGIKSAALAAAFLARDEQVRIGERHVRVAARRELEKQGVVVRPGQRGHR